MSKQTGATPWSGVPSEGPFLRPETAANYIGVSLPKLYDLAKRGDIPAPIPLSSRVSVFCKAHLDAAVTAKGGNR